MERGEEILQIFRTQNRLEFGNRLAEKGEGEGNSYFSSLRDWRGDGTTSPYREQGSREDRYRRQRRQAERGRRKFEFIYKFKVPVGPGHLEYI